MRRVALVCLLPDAGGVEHHVADLADALPDDVQVVVIGVAGGWLAREATARGLGVMTIPQCRGNFDLRALTALRSTLARLRPDIVHSHLGRSDWYAWLATVGMPVTLVSTEHGISADRPELYGGPLVRAVHRLAHGIRLRHTDLLIAVSQYTSDALMGRYAALTAHPPVVIHPGVDVTRLSTARHDDIAPGDVVRVACLSRLTPEKGVDLLVRAAALAVARGAALQVTVAGDGSERQRLERLAVGLGVGEHVAFVGRVPDVTTVLRRADILVVPSRSENLPLAALEALAARVPVLAADVGGVSEVVAPGVNGWLVEPEDTDALAAVLWSVGDGTALRALRADWADDETPSDVADMAQEVLRAYGSSHHR